MVGTPAARRSVPPVVLALRRFPDPRLTGIGAGLFAAAVMFLLACVDRLFFDASALVYGVLFVPVSALTALWVRPADLVTAPISVPIAFAVGVVPVAGGEGGLGGRLMAVVTALAVHAGWLYGGTLVAGVVATVRKVRQMRERQLLLAAKALRPAPGPPGDRDPDDDEPRPEYRPRPEGQSRPGRRARPAKARPVSGARGGPVGRGTAPRTPQA
ncbi:hypothetical protein OG233_10585 [Streptomyces sp. NBC_01218]|uniref:DUF6542 domain-containing protein n=1 Tax=Streptomyces sp. AM 2-1-1 TaxID=3028709 RepID=UPI0023BA0C8C|nr:MULTISPECIES: DUF6542 domain-containing protein [unclassified Streptomyces]WEH43652.1 hypothetical protein PZB77_10435 [Streptomyces sp. AM 2-1-1]WSQ55299.1 hypothetical protein OG233_10585 [Streptomyces sp. NBC_01218]